jgi:molybdopterin/thiamine biosynthesis adenylyltransferase
MRKIARVIECDTLPDVCTTDVTYHLHGKEAPGGYYKERTDRNLGWITRGEQALLRSKVVGVAGCGGMGGYVGGSILPRLGVDTIHLADCEVFDISNLNRQYAARQDTIGLSKAIETARQAHAITGDTSLRIYPQGISEETVDDFLDGCDIVLDEIEFLAVPFRILLHQRARARGIPLLNCNTPGFGIFCFKYTPESMTMEEAIGLSYQEALELHTRMLSGDEMALSKIIAAMMAAVVPFIAEYSEHPEANRAAFFRRLTEERRVPIIATNPPMASGFLADRVLFELLQNSGVKRDIVEIPPMPGYLHFDAARMIAEVNTTWRPRHDERDFCA